MGHVWHPFPDIVLEELRLVVSCLDDEIPLVRQHDARATRVGDDASDAAFLGGAGVLGVQDEEDQVAASDCQLGAVCAEESHDGRNLPLAAKSRGVNQGDWEPFPILFKDERQIHRVACGAGDVRDHHPIFPQQAVHQRGLAHVGAPHDGDAHRLLLLGVLLGFGQARGHLPEKLVNAMAVGAGCRKNLLHAKGSEDAVGGLHQVAVVSLVGAQEERLAGLPEERPHLLVLGGDAVKAVHNPNQAAGVLDYFGDLLADHAVEEVDLLVAVPGAQSTRVHKQKGLSTILGRGRDAVTGHAALLVDNRNPLLEDCIEESGLSDIGSPHDGHCWQVVLFHNVIAIELLVGLVSVEERCGGSRAPPARRPGIADAVF